MKRRFVVRTCAACSSRNASAFEEGVTIAGFLDRYYENYVLAEGLRDPVTIQSRLKAVRAVIGDLPVNALEKPADILRFKAAFRKGREVATVNRAWSTLRAAINWGRFQDPPYLTTTPFHRFGVTIKVKEETKRDRRIGLQEEQALLAACSDTGGPEHKYAGPSMHDRIIGALETCCRRGEMLRIQNRHIDWERHQIAIPGRHAKDDLHWHDIRHEGACRLLADGVDIRTIQLMLGHADIKQTQRYLNITDEELRKAMTGVWERRRQLRAVSQ